MSSVKVGTLADRPATVLHVINTGGPGGAETVCANIVRQLDPTRWRPLAVVPDRGWIYCELKNAGVDAFVVPDGARSDMPRYLFTLLQLVRRYDVRVIHGHLFGPSIIASLVGLITRRPVVCTLHGQGDLHPRERARALKFEILNRGASRVVFVSDALRTFFLATGRVRPELTAVIPNGIDAESYMSPRDNQLRAEFGASQSQFLVGAVGNLRPVKNYEIFIRAAAILKSRCADYRFVVIGLIDDEYGRSIVRLSEELGLGADVRFVGFRDDIARAIGTLDAYALTSRSEGFSISLIEALASGLPVVATKCGGPEQIVDDGITGLLVQNESANAVADAIGLLHSNGELRQRLASNGRAMVRERFTMLEQVRAYEKIYVDCLSGRRGSREAQRVTSATSAPTQVA